MYKVSLQKEREREALEKSREKVSSLSLSLEKRTLFLSLLNPTPVYFRDPKQNGL